VRYRGTRLSASAKRDRPAEVVLRPSAERQFAKSGRKSKVLIAAPISRKVHIVTPSNSHPKIRRQYTDLQLTAADYLI
jgi:hypothetical protein